MKALVIGGARSGKYISLLLNRDGYEVTLTDISKIEYKEELVSEGIKVVDEGHPESLLEVKYDLIIKNPGIKYTSPFIIKVLDQGYRIYNEIDVALRYSKGANIIAVSGTNGKTTTVSLLYKMMSSQYDNTYLCGNIGVPVSEIIYKYNDIDHLIIEMSSFQLDGCYDLKPQYAALTNLQSDHLDYYETLQDYYKSKQRIYMNQDENDTLIVNQDDSTLLDNLEKPKSKCIKYSLHNHSDVYLKNGKVICDDVTLFELKDMVLVGNHNVYNTMLAATIAYLNKVSLENIQNVVKTFTGVEHRIEFVDMIKGIKYYNDSKATNVESVSVALEAFSEPIILIAGGYDKNISFDSLKKYDHKVECAILFGETKHLLAEVFKNHILVNTLEEAVLLASDISKESKVVLFSPACASFDQFKDYEERGRVFKDYVLNLKNH